MSEGFLDGNGMAGLLEEMQVADPTMTIRRCQSCGEEFAIGEHRAFIGAGVVLRCPGCNAIAAVVIERDADVLVTWQGMLRVPSPS
jgi:hypothetical protein